MSKKMGCLCAKLAKTRSGRLVIFAADGFSAAKYRGDALDVSEVPKMSWQIELTGRQRDVRVRSSQWSSPVDIPLAKLDRGGRDQVRTLI